MWALQRRLHGHCMATFCPSHSTRNMLVSQDFNNLRLWPRGIDTSLFTPTRRNPNLRRRWLASVPPASKGKVTEGIIITYVGRLSTEKNIDLLINAFIRLKGKLNEVAGEVPTCRLVLVGEGPARKRLEDQTKDLDVIFMGYQKGEALAECYASSDIFAFPSHSETFGNVVLEAMASGLPIVGLQAEGISDLVENGSTGFLLQLENLPGAQLAKNADGIPSNVQELFEPKRESFDLAVDGFANLLFTLVVHSDLRKRLSEAAVAYAATRTWDQAMDCLLDGYREAATLTRQKRAEKLFSALSRTSSTISLLDVKTEEPPFLDTEEKQTEDNIVSGKSSSSSSSSRLLFGRPPIKKLLRRSTRTALKESISYRVKKTLNREYLLVGRESDSAAEKRRHPVYLKYFVLFLGLLLLLARTSETVLSVYASFQTSQAGVQPIYS